MGCSENGEEQIIWKERKEREREKGMNYKGRPPMFLL